MIALEEAYYKLQKQLFLTNKKGSLQCKPSKKYSVPFVNLH